MKPADRQFFGNLFQDFQQGHQFGSNIIDANRRRQMEDEQRKREAALDPVRLAKAQVDAERARLEYQQMPEEHRRKGVELDLAGRGMNVSEQRLAYDVKAPEREMAKHQMGTVDKVLSSLQTPEARGAVAAKPYDYWNSPEGQQELNQIAAKDFSRHSGREVGLASGKARVQQKEITKAFYDRKEAMGSRDVTKTLSEFDKTEAEMGENFGMNDEQKINAQMNRISQAKADLMRQKQLLSTTQDPLKKQLLQSQIAADEAKIQARESRLGVSVNPQAQQQVPAPADFQPPAHDPEFEAFMKQQGLDPITGLPLTGLPMTSQ